MTIIFGLAVVLAALLWLAYSLSRMKTRKAAQTLRITLGLAGILAGVLLSLRGLAVVGGPLIAAALGLLGVALRGGAQSSQPGEGGAEHPRRGSHPAMSRAEAAELLGVAQDADAGAINKAYRELMKSAHPDVGGDNAKAAQAAQARDILLGKR